MLGLSENDDPVSMAPDHGCGLRTAWCLHLYILSLVPWGLAALGKTTHLALPNGFCHSLLILQQNIFPILSGSRALKIFLIPVAKILLIDGSTGG